MTFEDARKTLESYLATNWTETSIAWENVDAIDPDAAGLSYLEDGQDAFVSVDIFVHTSQTITVPGSCIRYPGTLEFAVFVKQGKGTRAAAQYIDDLVTLFENQTLISPDTGERIRVRNIATTATWGTDSGWYVSQISFVFAFNRHVANP
jgi:hypothetical protein